MLDIKSPKAAVNFRRKKFGAKFLKVGSNVGSMVGTMAMVGSMVGSTYTGGFSLKAHWALTIVHRTSGNVITLSKQLFRIHILVPDIAAPDS
jgi:hypothetical protein